jgi:hypothetical protein
VSVRGNSDTDSRHSQLHYGNQNSSNDDAYSIQLQTRYNLFRFLKNCLSKSGRARSNGDEAFSSRADTSLIVPIEGSASTSGAPTDKGGRRDGTGRPCSPVRTCRLYRYILCGWSEVSVTGPSCYFHAMQYEENKCSRSRIMAVMANR